MNTISQTQLDGDVVSGRTIPVPGLAEAPDNQNGWIEWDVPLGGEMDEPMENPGFDDEEELNEFMDDDQDVGDEAI
ncbi:hypothetical protein Tco_1369666 [Tanacetum coccineum]